MMAETLRAGLVGLGMMGRNHARVLQGVEGVELVGAADPAGDVYASAAGVPIVASVDELLTFDLDICVVAVPTAEHVTAGLAVADAGVHGLIEKPMAESTAAATRLVEAFESRGLVGAVGHIERYNPALRALRSRLEHGELGDVYQVTTRRQGPFPGRIGDVGVVKDLATHDLDLSAWVTQLEYAQVSARVLHKSGREHEDMVAVLARLGEATIGNHLVNWLSPMKERVTVVTGERGCFVADTLHVDLSFFENASIASEWDALARFRGVSEGNMTRYAISKPEPLRVEIEAFCDAVRGQSSDIVTMRQGLKAIAVAEACLASAVSETTVSVEYP